MADGTPPPPPAALRNRNPLAWLVVFGPGAIIASLTLGSGELIFSTRGGVLFGYDILFLFVLISLLKWGLVFAMSRHMVLSGVHPYERLLEVPGPRGWFPLMLLLIAAVTTPVWISFFPGILGNFTSWITGTQSQLNGAVDYVWGIFFLVAAVVLALTSGYTRLERIQFVIVTLMMLCAAVTLVLYNPDWLAMLQGGIVPQPLDYPQWLPAEYPTIARNSVWVEVTRYVGVIGGAGFDYLAYVSWLREKDWGSSSTGRASSVQLQQIADDPTHPSRYWVRAPCIDCACSFALVVLFSAVFVASGVVVLGPERQIPTEDNFLDLQARFVTGIHPWLLPVYVTGAYLTIFGTLYGTLEVGVTISREILRGMSPEFAARHSARIRRFTIAWLAIGASVLLAWSFLHTLTGKTLDELKVPPLGDVGTEATLAEWKVEPGAPVASGDPLAIIRADGREIVVRWTSERKAAGRVLELRREPRQRVEVGETLAVVAHKAKPRLLLSLLTPANLFTGVLSVGLLCFLMPWMDRRFLPRGLRMPLWLTVLNVVAGAIFLFLGLKGYWDNHTPSDSWLSNRWFAIGGILAVAGLSIVMAYSIRRRRA